jgi:hypothetical protein
MACVWTTSLSVMAADNATQTQDEGWRLKFTVSGGIAGLNREFALESSGVATAFEHGRSVQIRRQVSRDELLEIERLAGAAESFAMPDNGFCRDCLNYSIDLRVSGRVVAIRANDITLSRSKAASLVRTLTRVQQRLLAAP